MKEYVVEDRYGYWSIVSADSTNDAVRRSSNLADEADMKYATTFYVGEASDISCEEMEYHNCGIAMKMGDSCRCGHHDDNQEKCDTEDLRGANLQGVDLKRANLQGVDLEEANLQGAYLKWADIRDAKM